MRNNIWNNIGIIFAVYVCSLSSGYSPLYNILKVKHFAEKRSCSFAEYPTRIQEKSLFYHVGRFLFMKWLSIRWFFITFSMAVWFQICASNFHGWNKKIFEQIHQNTLKASQSNNIRAQTNLEKLNGINIVLVSVVVPCL